MKVFLAILALVACASAEEWTVKTDKELEEIHHECAKLHSLSHEQIAKVEKLEFENEEPVRKYLVCTSKKIGVFSNDHGYYADRIAKQFKLNMSEEKAKTIAEYCIRQFYRTDAEDDVNVYAVHTCLMNTPVGHNLDFDAASVRPSKQD